MTHKNIAKGGALRGFNGCQRVLSRSQSKQGASLESLNLQLWVILRSTDDSLLLSLAGSFNATWGVKTFTAMSLVCFLRLQNYTCNFASYMPLLKIVVCMLTFLKKI